jgi:diaminopimelate epimerase
MRNSTNNKLKNNSKNKTKNQWQFSRLSGAGNSFLITTDVVPVGRQKKIAETLCRGKLGLIADGAIFLTRKNKTSWSWSFFNADGSTAEMCGNAARCVFEYINTMKEKAAKISLLTTAGAVTLSKKNSKLICVEMPKERILSTSNLNVEGIEGQLINSGVPHFVTEAAPDEDLAKKIRKNKIFGKPGSNVTFVKKISDSKIAAISFERGVEGFTLSCGTGAVAAAAYFKNKNQRSSNKFKIQMPGGELFVQWAQSDSKPDLMGTVKVEITNLSVNRSYL